MTFSSNMQRRSVTLWQRRQLSPEPSYRHCVTFLPVRYA